MNATGSRYTQNTLLKPGRVTLIVFQCVLKWRSLRLFWSGYPTRRRTRKEKDE